MKTTGITQAQAAIFWRQFSATCRHLGLTDDERRTAYRKQVLREEIGAEHMDEIVRTHGFESIMTRLCVDGENYEGASRFAAGQNTRLAAMCEDCAEQVMDLAESTACEPTGYLESIVRQARLGTPVTGDDGCVVVDVESRDLATLFRILDTHRRRLVKRALGDDAAGLTGYVFGRTWTWSNGVLAWLSPPQRSGVPWRRLNRLRLHVV